MSEVHGAWDDDGDLNEEHRKVLHRVRASIPSLVHEVVHPITERVAALETRAGNMEAGMGKLNTEMRQGMQHLSGQVVGLGVQLGKATGVTPPRAVTSEVSWTGAPIGEKSLLPWIAFMAIRQPKLFAFVFAVMAILVILLGSDKVTGWMAHWGLLPS